MNEFPVNLDEVNEKLQKMKGNLDVFEPVMTERSVGDIHTTATPALHFEMKPCDPNLRPTFRAIALRNGFKDKLQGDFSHDLHPYVYKTLQEVYELGYKTGQVQYNPIEQILQWHKDACPEPTVADVLTARACHLEEVSEYMQAIKVKKYDTVASVAQAHYYMSEVGRGIEPETAEVNKELLSAYVANTDKKEHLDSLCDMIVTALQDGYRSGYDMVGALNEVIRSNESKRLPDGTFPRNDAGKITKESPLFSPADVTPFIGVNSGE